MWLNLPAANKMVDPYFSMLWSEQVPKVTAQGATITAIAGNVGTAEPMAPPPDSWASQPGSDVAIWHVRLDANGSWSLPVADAEVNRVLYFFEGDTLQVADTTVPTNTGVVLDATAEVVVGSTEPAEFLVLQGRPIGEPVAQYGPFVMNDESEIRQAMHDYQATQFGGWPWPADDPVHGAEPRRFARYADGTTEELAPA